ncbi:MAG TPA: hypothetical protein VED01_03260 [Burkholderiales bacterium]|nr:hypothetical protein [Burkholderiales bacterium]
MQLCDARVHEALDAIANEANSGFLRLYSGSVPANADAALGGATLLAELTLNATAFGAAASRTLTANAITQDSSANASGTCSFARIYQSNGTTVWSQFTSIGTSGTEVVLSTTSIVAGQPVSCSSLTVSIPVGT